MKSNIRNYPVDFAKWHYLVGVRTTKEIQMIKHIVFWRFKDEAEGLNKEQITAKTKEILEDLVDKIPEIKELEVGLDLNGSAAAFEMALYTAFESKEALAIYQEHPAHQKVRDFIGKVTADRAVVDYEI